MHVLNLFFGLSCIAGTIVVQKFVLRADVPILLLIIFRTLIPGLFLLGYEFKANWPKVGRLKKIFDWQFLIITVSTTLLPLLLKTIAHKKMSSAKFALLGSVDPFITAILMLVIMGKGIDLTQVLGMATAVAGTIILALHKTGLDRQASPLLIFTWPELLTLISIALGRIGWIISQNLLQQKKFLPNEINIMFMFLPGAVAGIVGGFGGQVSWLWQESWSWSLMLGIVASASLNAFGCILITYSLKYFSALTISLAGTGIIPLLVAVASYWFYAEPLSWYWLFAALLIVCGMLVFSSPPRKVSA